MGFTNNLFSVIVLTFVVMGCTPQLDEGGESLVDLISPVPGLDQTITLDEDMTLVDPETAFVINQATDGDTDSADLQYFIVADPTDGVLSGDCISSTLKDNRNCFYVPNQNFNGTDRMSYRVFDGRSTSHIATVTFNVLPTADDPDITNPGVITMYEDNTPSTNVLFTINETPIGELDGAPDNANDLYVRVSTSDATLLPVDTASGFAITWSGNDLSASKLADDAGLPSVADSAIADYPPLATFGGFDPVAGRFYYAIGDGLADGGVTDALAMSFNPPADTSGTGYIYVQASIDGSNWFSAEQFQVDVLAVNDEPSNSTGTCATVNTALAATGITAIRGQALAIDFCYDEGGGTDEDGQTFQMYVDETNGAPADYTEGAINDATDYAFSGAVVAGGDGDDGVQSNDAGATSGASVMTLTITPDAALDKFVGTQNFTLTLQDDGGTPNGGDDTATYAFDVEWTNETPVVEAVVSGSYPGVSFAEGNEAFFALRIDEDDDAPDESALQEITVQIEIPNNDLVADMTGGTVLCNWDNGASPVARPLANPCTEQAGTTATIITFDIEDNANAATDNDVIIGFTSIANTYGTLNFTMRISDDGGTTWQVSNNYAVNWADDNDRPTIARDNGDPLGTTVDINEDTDETDAANVIVYDIDEGGLSGGATPTNEDEQNLTLRVDLVEADGAAPLNADLGITPAAVVGSTGIGVKAKWGTTDLLVTNSGAGFVEFDIADGALDALTNNLNLYFIPDADAYGTLTVTVTITDNGASVVTENGATAGPLTNDPLTPETFTLNIHRINDDPTITGSITDTSVNEDSSITLTYTVDEGGGYQHSRL